MGPHRSILQASNIFPYFKSLFNSFFFFLRYFIVCLQTSIELLISEYVGGLVSICDFASPLVSRPGGGWDKVKG